MVGAAEQNLCTFTWAATALLLYRHDPLIEMTGGSELLLADVKAPWLTPSLHPAAMLPWQV